MEKNVLIFRNNLYKEKFFLYKNYLECDEVILKSLLIALIRSARGLQYNEYVCLRRLCLLGRKQKL